MIRFAIPALAAATFASAAQAAEVQIQAQGPVVELTVSEVVDAKPDIVDLSAGVTSQARTAVEAMRINAREMTAVIEGHAQRGVAGLLSCSIDKTIVRTELGAQSDGEGQKLALAEAPLPSDQHVFKHFRPPRVS